MEQSPTGLFRSDLNGVLLDVNPSLVRMAGLSDRREMLGTRLDQYCVDPEPCRAAFRRLEEQESFENAEILLRSSSGPAVAGLLSLHRLEGTKEISGALRDITSWRAATEGLAEEAIHARTIIRAMSEGAVLLNAEGEIIASNPSAERILGLKTEEVVGRSTHDERFDTICEDGSPFPPEQHPVAVSLRTGEPQTGVVMGVHQPDGSLRWIRINSTPIVRPGEDRPYAVSATFADITDQRAMEERFLQAQKIDALGQLAGGVAHDFNNMLTVVFNRCELLMRLLPEGDVTRRYASEILIAARQSAELTQQLLGAARKQMLQPKVVELVPLVEGTLLLLARSLGENLTLRLTADPNAWRIMADPGKLRQVLINLMINARDAMPRGGTINIEIYNFVADEAYLKQYPQTGHGEFVTLAVSDTGSGIPPAIRSQIYDPFFTTKPEGKGSGLGLAVVRGIVDQTGGHIHLYSEVGRGTTFKLYLPRYEGDVEQLAAAAAAAPIPRGTETILLVEDEELVRGVLRECLEEYGYRVLEAHDGPHALEVAAASPEIDLLITDVMMPGVSGPEVADRLRAQLPGLRVVFMSGYTNGTIAQHAKIADHETFVEKPVLTSVLLPTIRRILDAV